MKSTYPGDRPQFFAVQFCRILADRRAAQQIGVQGFALLTVIVMTEDVTGYTKPVKFWRDDLAARLGVAPGTLDRIRKKCIAAGWLHYVKNARDKAGAYWVAIPAESTTPEPAKPVEPSLFQETPEPVPAATPNPAPADGVKPPAPAPGGERQSAPMCAPARTNVRASAHHSSLSSLSSPKDPLTPLRGDGVCAGTSDPATPAKAASHKPPPEKPVERTLFDALAEVSGSDPVVNHRPIRRLAKRLAAAKFEPEHVFDFGKRFHEICGYSIEVRLLHPRPSLRVIDSNIGRLRAGPPATPVPSVGPPRNKREEKNAFAKRMIADALGVNPSRQLGAS